MVSYPLQIVSPDGLLYDSDAVSVRLRTIEGDIGILARHASFVTALGMGVCRVDTEESVSRYAACIGGLVAVVDGKTRIVATTFEWADEIDLERAKSSKERAQEILKADSDVSSEVRASAQMRLRRADIRIFAAEQYGAKI